jgi:hypothetical protein
VNLLDLYRSLCKDTFFLMGGSGEFRVDQIAHIYKELRWLTRNELGMTRFRDPEIAWMTGVSIKSVDQMALGLRDSILRTSGFTLATKAILRDVKQAALARPIARMVVPVVALEVDAAEIPFYETAFPHRVTVVKPGEANVEAQVIEAFTSLKNLMNPPKENTNVES